MDTSEIRLTQADSTMEAAKALATTQDFLLVTADEQTQGKGTRGRPWHGVPGNIYMTVGIHRRHLPPERLALLPLEIGLHLWKEAWERISFPHRPYLHLKWPNDLMYKDAKAAGILIESSGNFLLVGIGVNVAAAPEIMDGGNPSACLADAGMPAEEKTAFIDGVYDRIKSATPSLIDREEYTVYDSQGLLVEWQGKMDWSRNYRLRDRAGRPFVRPLSINRQGHLQVEHVDGSREWLIADYLV